MVQIVRHFIACEDCNLVFAIRHISNDYRHCYNCNGRNIIPFALSGTKQELDNLEGKKYTTLIKERFKL